MRYTYAVSKIVNFKRTATSTNWLKMVLYNLYSDYVSLYLHVYPSHPPLPDYVSLDLHVYPFHPLLPSAENERKIICLFPILGETLLTSGVDA